MQKMTVANIRSRDMPTPLQIPLWIDGVAVGADFEVDVRAGGVACRAGVGDDLALRDALAGGNGEFLIVAVQGRQAVAVVDDDGIAIATDPVGFNDDT